MTRNYGVSLFFRINIALHFDRDRDMYVIFSNSDDTLSLRLLWEIIVMTSQNYTSYNSVAYKWLLILI